MNRNKSRALVVLAAMLFALPFAGGQVSHAQETQARHSQEIQSFPQTNQVVAGKVLEYWRAHGGIAQQGYPISDEFTETSASDGKPYAVQYFERAVLERHPENQPPYDIEGALLGDFAYAQKYSDDAPGQVPSTDNPVKFNETGKTLGGKFRTYWQD